MKIVGSKPRSVLLVLVLLAFDCAVLTWDVRIGYSVSATTYETTRRIDPIITSLTGPASAFSSRMARRIARRDARVVLGAFISLACGAMEARMIIPKRWGIVKGFLNEGIG